MSNVPSLKLLIVCPTLYPLLDPRVAGPIGGWDVRALTFARGLCERGVQVTLLVGDYGQPRRQVIDGLNVVVDPARRMRLAQGALARAQGAAELVSRWPWVRVRQWRLALLWQLPMLLLFALWRRRGAARGPAARLIYTQDRPDVLLTFGVSPLALEVVRSGRTAGVPCVVMVGSDHDLAEHVTAAPGTRNAYGEPGHLAHETLCRADQVVVQTEQQALLLARRVGRAGVVIRNPIDLTALALPPTDPPSPYVLWVGKSDEVKRPDLCLAVARQLGQIPFLMEMNRSNPARHDRLAAALPANVRLFERKSLAEMESLFAGAALLLNTSAFEGFPNTFLQAGKHAKPILSLTVDPDQMLSAHGAGGCALDDLAQLARTLGDWWEHPEVAARHGAAARAYVQQRHDLQGRVTELLAVLGKLGAVGQKVS